MIETLAAQTVGEMMVESGVAFGTSGARGLVSAMTDRVCHGYTVGFLRYLASIGEFAPGTHVALAGDLRPSTPRILAACAQALRDCGGVPEYCGLVPTPALALHAFAQGFPSLMVTGSHIPADRNGIKFYRPHGEVLKDDEACMMAQPVAVDGCAFTAEGALKAAAALPDAVDVSPTYRDRYADWFGADALSGMRIGFYQHSAVGRDLIPLILEDLGASVTLLGWSGTFVPVDTEAVRPEDIALARDWAAEHGFDAIVSTDGDSDRPLLSDERGEWLRGDVLGVLCARALQADRVVTPVSSNTALELSGAFAVTARTRIGSPYVIAEISKQIADGGTRVCGFEANGGFLLGNEIADGTRRLTALCTRDAVLPVIAVLCEARGTTLSSIVAALPRRVTCSDRITEFPVAKSRAILGWLEEGNDADRLARASEVFGALSGDTISIDRTDGLRMTFADGAIIHLRPSGNAPELRCYTEADTEERAKQLNVAALGLVRDGIAASA